MSFWPIPIDLKSGQFLGVPKMGDTLASEKLVDTGLIPDWPHHERYQKWWSLNNGERDVQNSWILRVSCFGKTNMWLNREYSLLRKMTLRTQAEERKWLACFGGSSRTIFLSHSDVQVGLSRDWDIYRYHIIISYNIHTPSPSWSPY